MQCTKFHTMTCVEQEPDSTRHAPREELEHHQWQNCNGSSVNNGMINKILVKNYLASFGVDGFIPSSDQLTSFIYFQLLSRCVTGLMILNFLHILRQQKSVKPTQPIMRCCLTKAKLDHLNQTWIWRLHKSRNLGFRKYPQNGVMPLKPRRYISIVPCLLLLAKPYNQI